MSDRYRRITGGIYGLVLGLVYALTAGTINWVVLRDVPLRQDWGVVLGDTAVSAALGAALGLLTAWPESFLIGVIFGALGISLGTTLQALLTAEFSVQLSVALLVTLLSRAAVSAPIALTLRALTHYHETAGSTYRFVVPASAVVLGLLFGSLSQMPPEAKAAVRQTHRIMQNALKAQTLEDLPPALRRVPDFQVRASPFYQLDQQLAPFSANRLYEVFVYFDNGYVVSCLYAAQGSPTCQDRTEVSALDSLAEPRIIAPIA
jgi:hypothetical protein